MTFDDDYDDDDDKRVISKHAAEGWVYCLVTAAALQERKWGPAVGLIGPDLAAAGGGDYGDETVDILRGAAWARAQVAAAGGRRSLSLVCRCPPSTSGSSARG